MTGKGGLQIRGGRVVVVMTDGRGGGHHDGGREGRV